MWLYISRRSSGWQGPGVVTGPVRRDRGTAHRDVRAARALDPEAGTLPQVGAALAAGEISREHANVCVRAVARLPKRLTRIHVVREPTGETVTGLELADRWLTDQCRRHPVRAVSRLAEELVRVLDPDREERYDEDAHLRRGVSSVRDSTGMGQLRVQLTPADAAVVEVLRAALGKPEPRRDVVTTDESGAEQLAVVRDERTAPMRRYDGLLALLRGAMSGGGPTGTAVVNLLVTATLEQVAAAGAAVERRASADGLPERPPAEVPAAFGRAAGQAHLQRSGPIGAHLLGYLACCATVTRILLDDRGSPLDVGRAHRLATPAQRKALAVRDGGCVVAGCACPVQGTDAHHVVAWQAGGATSLDNLVLLCPAHHQLVHAGVWQVEVHDGLARARPPGWIDAERRWLRNTLHRSHCEARKVGASCASPSTRTPRGHPSASTSGSARPTTRGPGSARRSSSGSGTAGPPVRRSGRDRWNPRRGGAVPDLWQPLTENS